MFVILFLCGEIASANKRNLNPFYNGLFKNSDTVLKCLEELYSTNDATITHNSCKNVSISKEEIIAVIAWGKTQYIIKNYGDAMHAYESASLLAQQFYGNDSDVNKAALFKMSGVDLSIQKFNEAIERLLILLELTDDKEAEKSISPKKDDVLFTLVLLYVKTKQIDNINKYSQMLIDYQKIRYGENHPKLQETINKIEYLKNYPSEPSVTKDPYSASFAIDLFRRWCLTNIQDISKIKTIAQKNKNIVLSSVAKDNENEAQKYTLIESNTEHFLELYISDSFSGCSVKGITNQMDLFSNEIVKNLNAQKEALPKDAESLAGQFKYIISDSSKDNNLYLYTVFDSIKNLPEINNNRDEYNIYTIKLISNHTK
jgi:hypothetical protein